ncbi:hypothetical protein BP6252_01323 [Coleophoma cylindrospora]|uniref:Peptidase A1 domain-containing protein n=1 Tax=Coleophoma cylindrospora TaxID=1849047 RepID=A0A3D8SSZ7_9HELO|nr:hypothetical protein BP6252_01323 [Coleophoma cylindrospora]
MRPCVDTWPVLILTLTSTASARHDGGILRYFHRRETIPAPIGIAASQDWDGNDGQWSTFPIQVGTPPQLVKVLPGTSAYQTLVVLPEGCIETDPSDCAQQRGGQFIRNSSSTWQANLANLTSNIYPLEIETRLGLTGRGLYGFDDITMGFKGAGGPQLKNQTVAGIATKDFFLGLLGLTPRPTNFTSYNNPIPSFVENLRASGLIPSTSWSYTAGNQYGLSRAVGSLTFGGYDSSRFVANNLTWPFNGDDIRDLTVKVGAVTSINSTSSSPLLSSPISAFIDSSLPHLYLPQSACDQFSNIFGLTWDVDLEVYLVNETQHVLNVAHNLSTVFTLVDASSAASANITLPYAAFDLTMTAPLVSSPTRYFPLKIAANESQYTLGRVFLQEAYVTADYDRREFQVSQSRFDANAQEHLVAVLPPNNTSSNTIAKTNSPTKPSSGLIAGASVGGVLLIAGIWVVVTIFVIKRRRRSRSTQAVTDPSSQHFDPSADCIKPEMDGTGVWATSDSNEGGLHPDFNHQKGTYQQLDIAEFESPEQTQRGRPHNYTPIEGSMVCETDGVQRFEADGRQTYEADGNPVQVFEMPAREAVDSELRTGNAGRSNET